MWMLIVLVTSASAAFCPSQPLFFDLSCCECMNGTCWICQYGCDNVTDCGWRDVTWREEANFWSIMACLMLAGVVVLGLLALWGFTCVHGRCPHACTCEKCKRRCGSGRRKCKGCTHCLHKWCLCKCCPCSRDGCDDGCYKCKKFWCCPCRSCLSCANTMAMRVGARV